MKQNDSSVDVSAGPDPMPKAGDTVNYVQAVNRIIPAKVVAVIDKSDGRTITVENPDPKAKGPVRLTHRPKGALAGNTWHWPAKALATLLLFCSLGFALKALAGLPTYHTFSGYGSGTSPATVMMPADPNAQIRVVTIYYTSDTNTAQFTFSSGSTAYSLAVTNPATSIITNLINSTNGLSVGAVLMLQHNGIDYTDTVASWGNVFTNLNGIVGITNAPWVVIGAGGWGVLPTVGDEMYLMTTPTAWWVGAGTNQLNGDDIFSGNYGRPVMIQLSPSYLTNRIPTASAHYDSQSQP